MTQREVDRTAIRRAADRIGELGMRMGDRAGRLDEEPFYLREHEWGHADGAVFKLKHTYDDLRNTVQRFLRDGAAALTELEEVLDRIATRMQVDEEIATDELTRIGRGVELLEEAERRASRPWRPVAE